MKTIKSENVIVQTIKIKPEHKSIIKDRFDRMLDARMAFKEISRLLRTTDEEFWEIANELYPEIKNLRYGYDHKTNTFEFVGRKKDSPCRK